jgi:hypothetical protein
VSLQIGYLLPIGARVGRAIPCPAKGFSAPIATGFGIVTLLIGIGLFGIFIVQTGGMSTISSLLSGRRPGQNDLFLNSTGYFYDGLVLAAPASLLLLSGAWWKGRRVSFLAIAGLAVGATLNLIDGNRLALLILFGPAVLLAYFMRNRRPGILALLVSAYVVMTAGIGFLRDVRGDPTGTPASRLSALGQSVVSPGQQFGALVLGSDNEMFDSLASELAMVPSTLPFQPGATLSDVAVRSVPRPLWPTKPLERNDAVVSALWPAHYAASRASPAFSILGPLYADSGWITVVIGMFLLGVSFAALWRYFQVHSRVLHVQIVYAMCLPLVLALLRGTLPDTLSYVPFTILPLLFVWAANSKPRSAAYLDLGRAGSRETVPVHE